MPSCAAAQGSSSTSSGSVVFVIVTKCAPVIDYDGKDGYAGNMQVTASQKVRLRLSSLWAANLSPGRSLRLPTHRRRRHHDLPVREVRQERRRPIRQLRPAGMSKAAIPLPKGSQGADDAPLLQRIVS
jgi:hypothetical protein